MNDINLNIPANQVSFRANMMTRSLDGVLRDDLFSLGPDILSQGHPQVLSALGDVANAIKRLDEITAKHLEGRL
jgi:hypothetical protein